MDCFRDVVGAHGRDGSPAVRVTSALFVRELAVFESCPTKARFLLISLCASSMFVFVFFMCRLAFSKELRRSGTERLAKRGRETGGYVVVAVLQALCPYTKNVKGYFLSKHGVPLGDRSSMNPW